jgi:hypothetical protein
VNPRSEPLLWLQLIGLGVLPLEALLMLLVLAGNDPGPLPGLERLLCWAIGALAPALLLFRRPADVWSLLLLQTPLRGRRDLQRRLSSLQSARGLRLAPASGAILALPLLWWIDRHAAVAAVFSPLASCPRLLALLMAALLLAVMLWQWQQLIQSLWLLSRSAETVAAAQPLTQAELEQQRLCLGLPLLLPDPLQPPPAPPTPPAEPEASATAPQEEAGTDLSAFSPVAVEPEQGGEETEGSDLDQGIG